MRKYLLRVGEGAAIAVVVAVAIVIWRTRGEGGSPPADDGWRRVQ